MCGIAGLCLFREKVNDAHIRLMLPGIFHRGPDGIGSHINDATGLLHTRLSIIDTSKLANQPLYNEDRTLALICNGEIYNHKALRSQLEAKGHHFNCDSDSEVLLHLYEDYRRNPLEMLNLLKGMFAFALLDTNNGTLFLARDRFGIKPLYYATDETGFYFASEINAILGVASHLRKSVDFTSLYEYYQYLSIPEPNTIYTGVKTLPAGSYALVANKKAAIYSWYALENVVPSEMVRDSRLFSDSLYAKIEHVINDHLISDVPVGSFLSAGIDSTIVTHFSSRNSISFPALSAGFPNYLEDESTIAKATAEKMGIEHYTFTLNGDFFEDAEEIMRYFDQPFAISSAFSLFRISKLARRKMKVVLTGDGGDEIFAGYDHKHKPFYLPPLVKNTPELLRPFFGKLLSILPGRKIKGISEQFCRSSGERFLNRSRVLSGQEAMALIPVCKRKFIDRGRFLWHVNDLFKRSKRFSSLHQILYVDLNTFLKSEMLYKVDRMTMANGLEGRVPFLDHELVEMAFTAAPSILRNGINGKLPLRNWVNDHYPGLGSRSKTGFNTPIQRFLAENESSRDRVVELFSELKGSGLIDDAELAGICNDTKENIICTSKIMLAVCLAGWWKHSLK